MPRTDHRLVTDDGETLSVYTWVPDGDSRGLVQIVHGLAEHARRYDAVAEALVDAGWAVVAHDQRGHGATAASDAELGHYADEGGWRRVIDDVRAVRAFGRERAPDGPIVLLGHSGGSFVSLSDQIDAPGTVDRLILSGSNRGGGALVKAGIWIAKLERRRQGRRGKSALVDFLSFGSFNKAFEPTRTKFDWLSRDPAQVDRYVADPRCGFWCSNQLWIDLLEALIDLGRAERLRRLPKTLPVYLLCGALDPVSDASKGVVALGQQLKAAGLEDVTVKVYPEGRHEMFNETNRDEVVGDLVGWLDERDRR